MAQAEDPLETAVRLSIAGNIIDLGLGREHDDLHSTVERVLAHYESLSGSGAPVFFLLQAKCPVIAQDLGVPVKSIILKQETATLTQGQVKWSAGSLLASPRACLEAGQGVFRPPRIWVRRR